MAEWTGDQLLQLARGFMEPRLLLTGAELDLFSKLATRPATVAELCVAEGWDARALRILLDALTALELLVKAGEQYACPPEVARWLSAASPESVLPMVLHAAVISQRWAQLVDRACGEPLPEPPARQRSFDLAAFIGAMHVVSQRTAPPLCAAFGVGAATRLLDVGGASGTWTMACLDLSPTLRATLFDRPPVIEMARARLAADGYLARVNLAPGDFYTDPLPDGHDLLLLSAIIHQNSDAQNRELYAKCFAALLPGGRIVIRDHVLDETRTQPKLGAIFAVNMLAATPGGDCFTLAETAAALESVGFERVQQLREDQRMDGLIEAWRPA
ncbi:MAG: hypothetical protein IT204_23035 [Fimbriimonadaceae bacterium]|nr:hypothetical protein [Fimbriimonadaceae bacterium]